MQRLLVGGRVEEAATVLARHVGDIDEAVEVAAAAGAAAVSFAPFCLCFIGFCLCSGFLLHAASLALAASRADLVDTVIGEKVPVARDVLLKELGRRKERVSHSGVVAEHYSDDDDVGYVAAVSHVSSVH